MNSLLVISISISMVIYYIFETNVVWEYLNKISTLFKNKKIEKFFYGTLLLKAYDQNNKENYLNFINSTYNTFFTRLISCPICLGFWFCFSVSIFTNIKFIFIYAFLSLLFYYIIKILTKLSSKI